MTSQDSTMAESTHEAAEPNATKGSTPEGFEHDEHGDPIHDEHPNLAHHFDTPQQQFDAGKLGIWLFLVTEVLFFAGLFCAYTIYRAQHPEIFVYAHYYLDTNLGFLNTCVLIFSSLTAAWAVRCAQLGQTKKLLAAIGVTIVCAFGFLGVKYVEYSHKVHDGLMWGEHFDPGTEVWQLETFKTKHPQAAELAAKIAAISEEETVPAKAEAAPDEVKSEEEAADTKLNRIHRLIGSASDEAVEPLVAAGVLDASSLKNEGLQRPQQAWVFFGIYFFMTGLHGIHVVAGILVWIWMFLRARTGVFNKDYFGPIDYSALYWHLVDLVWIYLFPLLYLIH